MRSRLYDLVMKAPASFAGGLGFISEQNPTKDFRIGIVVVILPDA